MWTPRKIHFLLWKWRAWENRGFLASSSSLSSFYHVGHTSTNISVSYYTTPKSIQPDTAKQARNALTRYCKIQMADNKKKELVYITKRQAGRLLWVGVVFLLVCMGLISLLFSSRNTLDALCGPRCWPKDSILVDRSFCGISI